MKALWICLMAAAFLLAGCASTHSTAMGAAPADRTICKDGRMLPPHSKCGLDKGSTH